MLQIIDLHTGNWVQNKDGNFMQFDINTFVPSDERAPNIDFESQGFKPIPVNAELVIKLGFTNQKDNWYQIQLGRQAFHLAYDEEMKDWNLSYQSDIGMMFNPIEWSGFQYVHWLQNIVYYLSHGQELTLKEPI